METCTDIVDRGSGPSTTAQDCHVDGPQILQIDDFCGRSSVIGELVTHAPAQRRARPRCSRNLGWRGGHGTGKHARKWKCVTLGVKVPLA
jgi:hypothetical protein